MTLTFSQWKRQYSKDRICKTDKEVELWLNAHGVKEMPSLASKYSGWICKQLPDKRVSLRRYKLILNIKGFKKPYKRIIVTLLPIKFMIKREYFNIFGNTCKILTTDMRTIERNPLPNVSICLTVLTAYVKPLYKEERSSYKISNFYLNARKRRQVDRKSHLRDIKSCLPANASSKAKVSKKKKLSLSDLNNRYKWSTPAYHKHLIHYFTDHLPRDVEQPRLVLMFGIPGSGKNWVLDKRRKRNHVVINVDDCLAMLPDYWRGMLELQERDKRAHDWIQTFREECQVIARQLFKFALSNKMNIVWNGTGKNINKYTKLMDMAKKRGYIIELNGIWVPLEVAKKRINTRRDSYGRPVPKKVFEKAALNIPSSFKQLRHEADYARIWKNEPCRSPRVIWDKEQGWIDDNADIINNIGWVCSR